MHAIYVKISKQKHKKINTIYLDIYEPMYLHSENVEKIWIPKIKKNQIFDNKN